MEICRCDAALKLAKWTQHHRDCARATTTAEDCTCGLQEAWIEVEAAPQRGAVDADELTRMVRRLRATWIIDALASGNVERQRLACAELLEAADPSRRGAV